MSPDTTGPDPDCHLIHDGGPQFIAVEEDSPSGHRQSLWVRVGQVFDGGLLRDEPGVWIEYQEEHLGSRLAGPVLLTPAVWRQLAVAVADALADRSA